MAVSDGGDSHDQLAVVVSGLRRRGVSGLLVPEIEAEQLQQAVRTVTLRLRGVLWSDGDRWHGCAGGDGRRGD